MNLHHDWQTLRHRMRWDEYVDGQTVLRNTLRRCGKRSWRVVRCIDRLRDTLITSRANLGSIDNCVAGEVVAPFDRDGFLPSQWSGGIGGITGEVSRIDSDNTCDNGRTECLYSMLCQPFGSYSPGI